MKKKACDCSLSEMLRSLENDKIILKELRKMKYKKDPNFKEGKFVQYTLLFEN